jgi:hypothetical protein
MGSSRAASGAKNSYFGKNQIYWECNQEHRSETQPEHEWRHDKSTQCTDFEHASKLQTTWKSLIGVATPQKPFLARTDALEDEWFYIVRLYSSCKLSQEEDKLVAISAIAKDMKR